VDKAREIREILRGPGSIVEGLAISASAAIAQRCQVRIVTLDEAGVAYDPAEDDIEAYDSFLANARAKASHFLRLTGMPTIADDSGLCVDALGGAPGVHSRRFASAHALAGLEQDRANNERLLHELRGAPPERRTAHYTCAAVLHTPDGRRFSALGTCSGLILDEARGRGGFGYDPLFLVPDIGRSFGEMSLAEKQQHSHRARAFRALTYAASVLDHPSSLR
jgi:XTP/dITP diphosphohydrolase